jgi:hypothetical protein
MTNDEGDGGDSFIMSHRDTPTIGRQCRIALIALIVLIRLIAPIAPIAQA